MRRSENADNLRRNDKRKGDAHRLFTNRNPFLFFAANGLTPLSTACGACKGPFFVEGENESELSGAAKCAILITAQGTEETPCTNERSFMKRSRNA